MAVTLSLVFGAMGVSWMASRYIQEMYKRRSLPPGPPGRPIIGHVGNFHKGEKWRTFTEWAPRYGEFLAPRIKLVSD
jgi:hypothetical protein